MVNASQQIYFKIKSTFPLFLGFLVLLLGLTGCNYIPEKVDVSYEPLIQFTPTIQANAAPLDVIVVDSRREGAQVGCKKGEYGIELASIRLKNNLAEVIQEALRTELKSRGFSISTQGNVIEIDIQKFYNDFKPGYITHRGVAELLLSVHVKKNNGDIVYSKNIIGSGENQRIWLTSGKNAKIALDAALSDAIHKIVNDPSFVQCLLKKS